MIPSIGMETLDDAFRRVRDLDVSLQEQLRAFADTVKRERPEFAAAVDRLIQRLRQYGAGESAPQIGESMPPFVLPDDAGCRNSLRSSNHSRMCRFQSSRTWITDMLSLLI
jgi:hypothetical protein